MSKSKVQDTDFRIICERIRSSDRTLLTITTEEYTIHTITEKRDKNGKVTTSESRDIEASTRRMYELSHALKSNTSVTSLDMSFSPDVHLLLSCFPNNTSITTLNLHGCTFGLSGTAVGLKMVMPIPFLFVAGSETVRGGNNMDEICRVLSTTRNLTSLDLSWTSIHDSEARTLFAALESNVSLRSLSLDRNWIGNESCEAIVRCLEMNHSLQKLSLKKNTLKIDVTTAEVIVDIFHHNRTLEHLSLDGNTFEPGTTGILTSVRNFNDVVTIGVDSDSSCIVM